MARKRELEAEISTLRVQLAEARLEADRLRSQQAGHVCRPPLAAQPWQPHPGSSIAPPAFPVTSTCESPLSYWAAGGVIRSPAFGSSTVTTGMPPAVAAGTGICP